MTDVAVVASPIDTFWDLLNTQGCLNSGNTSLNIGPASQLGSPPIAALIADAALFPTGALQMTLTSATHVRSALSRFDQVADVSDADRALAFENIRRAASYFDVQMTEKSWHDLMPSPGGQ